MSKSNELFSISVSVEKIRSIKYFTPARTLEEANLLLPKINELVENHIKDLDVWKKENASLQHASDSLWDIARVAAMKAERTNTWDSAWDYAWKQASYSARDNYGWYGGAYVSGETARDSARDAAKYAARFIAFESAKDQLGSNNPFSHLIELYVMGLKPTYFRKIDEQERFVVDLPLKVDGKFVLGCYAHGDKEITFSHEWKEYCTNLLPLKENKTPRSIE
ncbi:Uncharacterised protein [uncultured archaeon]|nr:Uncharacterised protein [uncultured archaeon]